MYPYSNSNGCKAPWTSVSCNYYNDTNYSKVPQEHYYTPSSSSFLLTSPSYASLEDEPVFGEFLPQQFFSNVHNYHNTIIPDHEMVTNVKSTMGECSNTGQVAVITGDDEPYDFSAHVEPENTSRKRPNSKGDRHSKINTAQGPRDRRMRLSLDVAKKLFGLQDLLGFDKASKTVDWLLTKSKAAILELLPDNSCSFMGVSNSASSTSECEVMSGTGDHSMVKTGDDQVSTEKNTAKSDGSSKKQKEKNTRARRSADLHHPLAKEKRAKARAKARERTTEKKNYELCGDRYSNFRPCPEQVMDQNVNQLGSWSPFTESQRQSIDQPDHINLHFPIKQGFVGDNPSLMKTSNWLPSYFN